MRILSVFWSDKVRTGAHKRMLHLLRGLARRGHDVMLVAKRGYNFETGNIRVAELDSKGFPSSKLDSLWSLAVSGVDWGSRDIIIGFGLGSVIPGVYLKHKTGARLLFGLRSHPVKNILKKNVAFEFTEKMITKIYLKIALLGADIITTQVSSHRKFVVNKKGVKEDKTFVVPNNIMSEVLSAEVDDKAENILFVGTICQRKGVDTLLEAFRILKDRGSPQMLHIAGEGPMLEEAQRYVKKQKLDDWVNFHGFVDEVRPLMARCDLVVIPSRVETFPNVALEAMSVGTPFLTTDLKELRSAFGQAARYVHPDDPVQLADTIGSLCDPQNYKRLTEKMMRKRARFDFDWVGQYEELLQEVVARQEAVSV